MAWKEIEGSAPSSGYNNYIINYGEPGISSKIVPIRGFLVSIPSVDGGEGTVLSYDTTLPYNLNDDDYINNVVYNSTNYYVLYPDNGRSIGLELKYVSIFDKIIIYLNGYTGTTLNTNTFYIMTSFDGINWTPNRSIPSSEVTYETFTDYARIIINLDPVVQTQYLAIRALERLSFYTGGSNPDARIRELNIFTPENIGLANDIYKDYETNKEYKKINGSWVVNFIPPDYPINIIGNSMIPPSAANVSIGSLYIVRE